MSVLLEGRYLPSLHERIKHFHRPRRKR
ncbi:hypothetical protein LCGC14_1681290, partial [marine sediment metagenome]